MRDCTIVHAGAVCVMVRLLPKLYKEGHAQVSLNISKCHLNSVLYFCVASFPAIAQSLQMWQYYIYLKHCQEEQNKFH